MERNTNSMKGYTLGATDGLIGNVDDFYFDDDSWNIRYIVVKTGTWLSGRKVLIAPVALIKKPWLTSTLPVNLTMEQVRTSPDIDTDEPVSRRQELLLHQHYGWRSYLHDGFDVGGIWEIMPPPVTAIEKVSTPDDLHLHSTKAITGYHIHALDSNIGHLTDFIFDDVSWQLKYIIVDTHNWFGRKKVLVSVKHIKQIEWGSCEIFLNVVADFIKNSKQFEGSAYAPVL